MCPSLGIRIHDHATWLPSNFNYLETFSIERFSMQILTAAIRELLFSINYGFPWRLSKESAWNTGKTWVRSLCQEDPLEKGMTTHSNILAWEIPQTEEPGRLHSMGPESTLTSFSCAKCSAENLFYTWTHLSLTTVFRGRDLLRGNSHATRLIIWPGS